MPTMFSTLHMRFLSTTHTVQFRHSSQSHPYHAHYVIHTHTTLQSHCSVLTHTLFIHHTYDHQHTFTAHMHPCTCYTHRTTQFLVHTHTHRAHKHCSVYTPHMTLQFTATLLVHTHYTTHFSIHTHTCTNFSPRNTLHTHSSVDIHIVQVWCVGVFLVCRCALQGVYSCVPGV